MEMGDKIRYTEHNGSNDLKREVYMSIYFDNGSTSFPKAPGVAEAVGGLIASGAFNINRGGYAGAYEVAGAVFETRELLCRMFGFLGECKNAVFTPSVTYALNMILKGWLRPGDHVVTTSMEHNAVMRPLVQLQKAGVRFDAAQADERGVLDPEKIEALIRPETRAVVMTAASNVCGTLMPLREVGEICARRGVRFIVDSAQAAGLFPLSMTELHIDALTFTGHKSLLGPQGIGGMILRTDLAEEIEPLVSGGTGSMSDSEEVPPFLPDRFEPGTLNLPGIIGLHTALLFLQETGIDTLREHDLRLTARFLDGVRELPHTRVVGLPGVEGRAPIVSLDFGTLDNAEVAYTLDSRYGVMTRCGLHCAPRAHKSLGTFPQGTVRFAFGYGNTESEVDQCLDALKEITRQ